MRRRPRKGRSVRLCPQCGSPKITIVAGMITGQVYHCEKCDYVGSLVFETDLPEEPAADDSR
jgi:predicted RNA-binding Zn-ribbon protein involved in translation (DUF1610 family)